MPRIAAMLPLVLVAAACVRTAPHHAVEAGEWGTGLASFYAASLQGHPTASGQPYDAEAFTAAHRTLAFGTCVEVEELQSGRTVQVRVNDRGPFVAGRLIDVSMAAARRLDFVGRGVTKVRLRPCP